MTGLLDQVAAATQNGRRATVLREQHDAGQINWVGGLTDPGEMIGCGMYQELRRFDNENDETYAARLRVVLKTIPKHDRERIETAMQAAAIKRAGLDNVNGKIGLVTAGKLPWHSLGVHVDRPMTDAAQCLELSGQNFKVGKIKLFYEYNGKQIPTDRYAIARLDTGARLDERSVGEVYEPMQNIDGYEVLDDVLAEFGARYESAGSLYGGAQVFICAHLPKQRFSVNGTDNQEPYVLFFNPHDGMGQSRLCPTSVRAECANTTRIALAGAAKVLKWKHTGNAKANIAEAQRMLGLAVTGFEAYKEQATALAAKKMPVPIKAYANDVLDTVLEVTAAEADQGAGLLAQMIAKDEAHRKLLTKTFEAKIERRGEILMDILERYEAEKNGTNGMRGTGWSYYNAVTEHADHHTLGRKVGSQEVRDSRRLESILEGDGDQMKQAALEKALAI